jgi:hypothetical protein
MDQFKVGDRVLVGYWVLLHNNKKAFVRNDFVFRTRPDDRHPFACEPVYVRIKKLK